MSGMVRLVSGAQKEAEAAFEEGNISEATSYRTPLFVTVHRAQARFELVI